MKNKEKFFVAGAFALGLYILLGTNIGQADNTHSGSFAKSSSQSAQIADDLGINGGNVTLETWVNFSSLPSGTSFPDAYRCITSTADNGTHVSYSLYYFHDGGGYHFDAVRTKGGIGQGYVRWDGDNISTNTWYHVVLRYDGTDIKLYTAPLGGSHTERGSSATSGSGSSGMADHFMIGDVSDDTTTLTNSGCYFDGQIDDVRIWNTARSTSDLNTYFQQELSGSESGLVAYYKLNNDWNDTTSNAKHLTAVNSPTFSSGVDFPVAPIISTFSASPNPILVGQSSLLSWDVTGATSVVIDQGIGSVSSSGSTSVSPTATTTYTITTSDNGLATSTDIVTIGVGTIPTSVRKSTNQSISSNTTLQNDSQLSLSLQPGMYIVEGLVIASSTSATPDLKVAFTAPTGSDLNLGYMEGLGTSAGMLLTSGATSDRISLSPNTPVPVMVRGTIVINTAGNLQLQWSQFTSNANAVNVAKGSYLKVTQI